MRSIIINKNFAVIKSWSKKFYKNIYKQQVEDNNIKEDKDKDENDNDIIQTMWKKILYYTKFKSSLGHKTVLNCIISYLIILMITGLEFRKLRK